MWCGMGYGNGMAAQRRERNDDKHRADGGDSTDDDHQQTRPTDYSVRNNSILGLATRVQSRCYACNRRETKIVLAINSFP